MLAFAAASCGEGGGDAGDFMTVQAVVDALAAKGVSCTNLDQSGENQLFTREDGRCDVGQETVNIVTFASTSNRDSYLEFADQFGGIYVVGDTWVVGVDTQATAERIRAAIGGEIR